MAVQAQQYPSNGFLRLPSDFGLENYQQLLQQPMQQPQQLFGVFGDVAGGLYVLNNGTPAFSEQQGSELTSNNNNINVSGSRKRPRESVPVIGNTVTATSFEKKRFAKDVPCHDSSTNRLAQSTMTSTSGRQYDSFMHQSVDLESIVRLECERMKAALMETTRRNYRNLLAVLSQNFQKRMNEKECQLHNAIRQNVVLEQKVKQLAEETQIWYTLAKNNESVIADLRSNLEHVLLHCKEGYGDTAEEHIADDAQSCCFDNTETFRENTRSGSCMCRACGSAEAHVLLLPCRHLCLCAQCETIVRTCPVCNEVKNAGVPILLG